MRATATPAPIRNGKRRLLESCAIMAGLAALACGGPAWSQVAGTGEAVAGPGLSIPTISPPGPGATNVNTTGNQTIINWTPTDTATSGGAIDFLPQGNTLTFNGTGNYTVLNRFVNGAGGSLSRQVALNGTVNSTNAAASGARGGNIWFYNAGGILIGATGVINVGSLVLTTNDIVTTGGLFGPSGEIRFRGAAGSTSAITVNGAINANYATNAGGAYVALVAPRIIQAGNVRVDGSAAYVAAEQADIRINSGLFDINVTVGAEGGNAITHTGSTTGPAHQQGDTDQSRIYMVAIPKNDAVTMLVSGQIGYDDALSAQVDPDGAVRLSAGYNVTGGELNATPVNATAANITVNDTLFRSSLIARASGALTAQALQQLPPAPGSPSQGRVFVEGNASFIGDTSATITSGTGQIVGATGNFGMVSAGRVGAPGTVALNVNGGQLSVTGGLALNATGVLDAVTGNRQGGTASLSITNGGLAVAGGAINVSANAAGGLSAGGAGGDGRGGAAAITVSGSGSLLSGTNIIASAVGSGGGLSTFPTTIADISGNGFGGNATVLVDNGGSLSASGFLTAAAGGSGTIGLTQSGSGQGGIARIAVTGTGSNLQATNANINAASNGGSGISDPILGTFNTLNAGNAQGGQAILEINADATSTVNVGNVNISASGSGGNAGGENATGGNGRGGTASLAAAGGATAQLNSLSLSAAGAGGSASSPSFQTSASGDGVGGTINVTATGGSTLAIGTSVTLTATGISATGDTIGSGEGGAVLVSATNNGNINVNDQLLVNASGGSFGSAVLAQSAGSGTGGDVDLIADGSGAIRADSYLVNASAGVVNVTGASGAAQGGTIDVTASGNGQVLVTNDGNHVFDTSAASGISAGGTSATGGSIRFIANGGGIDMGAGATMAAGGVSGGAINAGPNNPVGRGGTILIQVVADALDSSAIGLGNFTASSDGLTAVNVEGSPELPRNTAGSGQGGTIGFDVQGGTLTASGIRASANGVGGRAGGSVGTGGSASFTQTGGNATVGDMTISVDGFGGVAQGQSGLGLGGNARIDLLGGTITAADIVATANGLGGAGSEGNDADSTNVIAGGLGGGGQGGSATITIGGPAVVDASILLANATGTGGAGGGFVNTSSFGGAPGTPGGGGNGTGGTATVNIGGGTTASSVIADASGIGGSGGGSFFSSSSGGATGVGVGGSGGTGQGGTATIGLQTAIAGVGNASSIAQGVGGNGGNHNVGGSGGDGFGGLARAIVTNFDAGQLAVTLDSSGLGGNGANGRDGAGGSGGGGNGGVSRIAADGPGASLTAVATNFITGGTGGNGGNGQLGFGSFPLTAPSGGNGGGGRGGAIEVAAAAGATVTLGIVTGDSVVLASSGTGGNGGNGANSIFNAGAVAGNGGFGGAGTGGTVRLVTNGGTITSNTESVEINANGVSGAGGAGGTGQGGGSNGAAGGSFGTIGGRVAIEALNGLTGPGAITLGNTDVNANGDVAGRIELRAEGNIGFLGLNAEASGSADPTNNNTDEAPAGIFLALHGGTITSQGDVSLTTGSSVGAYAQSNGLFDVDGILTIEAADQIDIRHDVREGAAPTIRASDSLTATAGGISGAPGSLLSSGDTLSLTSTIGAVGVDRLDAVNIAIDAAGAASVEHAEAANDFTASGASFRTGLNSIITGGDISVTSPGTVDLGNSTAGGLVSVQGQSIAFNAVNAGTTVSLRAQGFGASDGIDGGTITATGAVTLNGRSVTVDAVQTDGSLSVSANNGAAALAAANANGDIFVSANGNVTGSFASGGNIRLRSTADITAAANATGGYVDPATGLVSEGLVFADADGNLTVTGGSAATMFGARAGGSVAMQGVTAGEDVLVLAGTTANLSAVSAGDDLRVQANGGITVLSSQTTGTGPDGRSIVYQACCSNPAPFLQIQTSTADLSNVTLLAPTSTIAATNVTAFDNFTATAGGTVTTGGLIRSGLATNITGSSLNLAAITAGTDIGLTANTGGVSSTGALAAGDDVRVNAGGALTIGGIYSDGTGADNEGDGSNIVLTGGAANVTHAEAGNDFVANTASFTTGLNSIITGGDILVISPGAVDLGNSTAGGFVSVNGQSILFNSITAGTTVDLNATGTATGAEGIRGGSIGAGSGVNLFGNSIALTGTVTGGASFFAFGSGAAVAINQANVAGDIAVVAAGDVTGAYVSGGNITLNSGANIIASAVANGGYVGPNGISEGYVLADAGGNATLTNSSAATMFGVRAGQAASLGTATAGEDVFVIAGTTATLANITAGDDLTANAPGGITANGLTTTGAGPDSRTLIYEASPSGASALQITSAPADDSNIVLTASAGDIGGGTMNAFDNLTLVAAGAITTTGVLRSGQATSIDGRSIVFDAIDAGTTVDASASGTIAGAEGIRGVDIAAGGDINLNGNSIALTGAVAGGGSFFATATGGSAAVNDADIDGNIIVVATDNLTGTYTAGGAIRLNAGANVDASATASGTTAEGNLFVDAGGDVLLANSTAARMFGVNAGGSATITGGAAGEDMLVQTGTTASLTNITAGDDIEIRAGGNVTANNVSATGTGADTHFLNYLPASGFTIMQGEGNSAINGSDINATSGGSITATALSAGDDIALLATSGNAQLSNATTLGLGTTAGSSNIRVEAIDATLAGLDSADDVLVIASGTAAITGAIAADRDISIDAGAASLATLMTPGGNPIDTLSADRNITVASAGNINGGRINALGNVALTADGTVDVAAIFGNNVAVDGATGIAAEQIFAVGTTTLNSDNGAIALGTLVSSDNVDARADSISIDGGSMVFSNIVTDVGDAVVSAGDLFVINGNIAGRAEFSSSGERLGVGTLTARSALLEASGGFMTLDNVTVTDGLDASARTSLGINGVVTGRSISLASAGIDIAPTGRVGTAGATRSVSIANNNSGNQTFVGGAGTPNGYHIDAAELTRVFGTDIEIFVPEVQTAGILSVGSTTPPDVIVDSFVLAGGAPNSNLGANGALTIRTPGKMRVIGNVQLTGLTDTNALNLFADQALEIILGQGTVRLVNGAAPAGQLNMISDDIIVATAAAIGDVGAATTTDAIETRLAQNDGIVLDEGALFARGIRAEVVGGFYVQNSGNSSGTRYAGRRGLTFGAGGLDVLTQGPSRIVINGVHLGPNGQVTGLDTIPLLTIAGTVPAPGSFDPRSTFNGCLITGASACAVSLESSFPVQDVIEEQADSDSNDGDGNILPTPLITMRDLDPLSGEPLLDDPVTGAGNDDLWTPTLDTCDPASAGGGSCPAAD